MFENVIDPRRGGAALVVSGEVLKSNQITDEKTGEVKCLVEVGWWGGSSFFVVDLQHPLMRVTPGSPVNLAVPFAKGKTGWRSNGEPQVMEAKPAANVKAGAA